MMMPMDDYRSYRLQRIADEGAVGRFCRCEGVDTTYLKQMVKDAVCRRDDLLCRMVAWLQKVVSLNREHGDPKSPSGQTDGSSDAQKSDSGDNLRKVC